MRDRPFSGNSVIRAHRDTNIFSLPFKWSATAGRQSGHVFTHTRCGGGGHRHFSHRQTRTRNAGVAHLRRRGQPASPTPIAPQASKKDKERKKEGRKQRKTERKKERQSKRNKYRQADRQKERQKLITSRTKQSKNEKTERQT